MWNQFDINVLVNGSRCKQYEHNGRKYIEAKDGSEWYFQIQNNTPGRILAVCSVDGLNVLSGETAKPDDTGYIIGAYHSQKIKGFRFSDDEWALFKFGYKLNGKTYAQSKGNGAERNCGVIGVRLFYEVPKQVEYIPEPAPPYQWTCHCSGSSWGNYAVTGGWSGNVNWSPGGTTTSAGVGGLYGPGRFGYTPDPNDRFNLQNMTEDHYIPTKGIITSKNSRMYPTDRNSLRDRFNRVRSTSYNAYTQDKPRGFDIGTEWGKREKSKVQTVDFERGCEAYVVDIYYASRESLIEMGVPLTNNIMVNRLPESFPNRYATPPRGWNG